MIKCGYHGNDTPANPNMVVFVHPPRYPTSTQKMKGGYNFSFPTLLHFPGELLLNSFAKIYLSEYISQMVVYIFEYILPYIYIIVTKNLLIILLMLTLLLPRV